MIVIFCFLTGCSVQTTELESDFIKRVDYSIDENGSVDFDDIADFEWDKLIVIGPYMTVNHVLEEEGLNWRNPITHIQNSDGNTLLLFSFENNVVEFIHFPRHRDFAQFLQQGSHLSVNRDEAVFAFDNGVITR